MQNNTNGGDKITLKLEIASAQFEAFQRVATEVGGAKPKDILLALACEGLAARRRAEVEPAIELGYLLWHYVFCGAVPAEAHWHPDAKPKTRETLTLEVNTEKLSKIKAACASMGIKESAVPSCIGAFIDSFPLEEDEEALAQMHNYPSLKAAEDAAKTFFSNYGGHETTELFYEGKDGTLHRRIFRNRRYKIGMRQMIANAKSSSKKVS